MPTDREDTEDGERAVDDALHEGIADLVGAEQAAELGPVDARWIAIGMRLGLERPGRARSLLEMMGAREAARPGPADAEAGPAGGGASRAADEPPGAASIPVASALLARAAALSPSALTSAGPEVAFGWVARLSPGEILRLGQVVGEMLAAGSPPDLGRGFGIAWSAGVRVPRDELETMMEDFAELEITVGGLLAGRELRTGQPADKPQGIAAWLGDWIPRTRPGESQAAAAIERSGDAGRRGLVALWNTWMAMRYRARIPQPTFELMVQPWVTVIGPLPE